MRGARWLLLVMIVAILGGVGITYRARKQVLREQAPPKPQPLPPELGSAAGQYHLEHSIEGRKVWEIDADDERQLADASRVDLKGVTLKLYGKDSSEYDLVKSAAASLTTADNRFYSDGDVEITLGVPVNGQPKHTLVSIKSSGISLDRNTGRAETDRPATFVFQNGEGKATGAYYDPTTRDLVMKSNVELHWTPTGPNARPMKVEASSATYKESLSEIWLKPWGKLTRGDMVVEGTDDVVRLDKPDGDGKRRIKQVEANSAHGTDAYPNRKLQYSADSLFMDFNDAGEIQKITGSGRAQLVSTSAASETAVKAGRVELNFAPKDNESVLALVNATGGSEVQSKPLPSPGRQPGETHILRADAFDLKMRPDGKEIESVVTRSPGTLEFLPNTPVQHHRMLESKQMTIAYGPENRVESFHATDAKTKTDPTAEERKRGRTVFYTTSRDLLARFNPKTSSLDSMEQSGDFSYDEGERHARASKATLDSGGNTILLDPPARVWDATSSTAADRIRLDQRTGDFTADGNVRSSRVPDKDQKKSSEMLSGDEPLQAQARKMDARDRNRRIHYEGDALMWQGANQIRADRIDVDREKRTLAADGNVTTSLWEQPKEDQSKGGPKKAPPSPVMTVVHAPHMIYTDADRLAHYSGGVTLTRAGLRVKAAEIRAYLSPQGSGSSLDKAIADGNVDVVQTAPGRTRTGAGSHAEYYAANQKVIMRGAPANFVDGTTTSQGLELTYYANDDSLRIDGAPNSPVKTQITHGRK